MDITPEYLRDTAVGVVRDYIAYKTPLTDGVFSVASRDKLSPEQIKRIVEVVNQVAYLKLLESAEDRTFEFPLASYDDIMAKILSPEEIVEEGVKPSLLSAFHEDEGEPLDKQASEYSPLNSMSQQERETRLYQEYVRTNAALEKMAHDEMVMVDSLVAYAEKCKKDEEFLSKVAHVTDGDDAVVKKISKLVYGQVKEANEEDLFYEEDLKSAKKMVAMLKQAEELVERKAALSKSAAAAKNYFVDRAQKLGENVQAGGKMIGEALRHPLDKGLRRGIRAVPKVDLGLTMATYRPEDNIWQNLHKPFAE